MADVGDKVSVASKSGPRLGVVLSTSGSMLQVRWESGEETSLIPGPGTLTVLGKTRKRSPGAAKVKPGRSAAKAPTRAKAKTPATKKATAKKATAKTKAAPKKSAATTPAKMASKSNNKKAASANSPSKPPAKKSGPKAR